MVTGYLLCEVGTKVETTVEYLPCNTEGPTENEDLTDRFLKGSFTTRIPVVLSPSVRYITSS
jgi:hypothetical protein